MMESRLRWVISAVAVAVPVAAISATTPERAVVVPLQIRGNFPILTAKIDGTDVPLMFDLGGDFHLTLSESILQKVQTTSVSETYAFSDAKGNIVQSPMFKVRRIDIGQASFTDVIGHVDASHPTYRATTVGREGMIGAPFLHAYRVVLDYAHREMTLIPNENPTPERDGCSGTVVPFLPEWDGAPVTKAATDAGELAMVWDTGAPLSMIRKGRVDQVGLKTENSVVNSAKFELGGRDFGPLQLRIFDYVEPAGTDGFIGHSFFERNVVCIDFAGKRLLIRNE